MPDASAQQRACPACGRANEMSARTCEGCGASFAGRVVLVAEAERRSAYASEFPTVRDGSWQGVALKREQVPLPPQIQAEAFRREQEANRREAERRAALEKQEALRRDEERRLAEQERAAREHAARVARQKKVEEEEALRERLRSATFTVVDRRSVAQTCHACGAPPELEQGVRFSFCGNCGADLAANSAAAETAAAAALSARPPGPASAALATTAQAADATAFSFQQEEERRVRGTTAQAVAVQQTSAAAPQQQRQSTFSPNACAAAAFFVPGLGQMLNGQGGKGLVLLLAGLVLTANVGFWGVTMVIARLLMALDAYRIAEKRRRGETIGNWEWDIQ